MNSTIHDTNTIGQVTGEVCKLEVSTFNNCTNGGVDQMKSLCSVLRISCRWPMIVFFTMLNITGINSYLIHCANIPSINNSCRIYLKKFANELVKPYLLKRATMKLPKSLYLQIKKYLDLPNLSDEMDAPVQEPAAEPGNHKNKNNLWTLFL